MKKLKLTERNFETVIDGKTISHKITRPTFKIGNKADLVYKRGFGEALKEGLLTAFQMKSVMDDIKYFSEASDETQELDTKINDKIAELDKLSKDEEAKATQVILKIKELRARKTLALFKINSVYDNSAESYAENIRNQFYAAHLTCTADGKRVWADFDSFKDDSENSLCAEAVTQVMLFNAQIGDNYEMEHEENQWLLKNGFIDKDGNFIKEEKDEVEGEEKKSGGEDDIEVGEVKDAERADSTLMDAALESSSPAVTEGEKDKTVSTKNKKKSSTKKSVSKGKDTPPNVTEVNKK